MANYRVFGTNDSNIIHIGFWKGKLSGFSENIQKIFFNSHTQSSYPSSKSACYGTPSTVAASYFGLRTKSLLRCAE